ncbi:MAG: hypothetical protein ACE5F1_03040 [Planctomycetota bacterium]
MTALVVLVYLTQLCAGLLVACPLCKGRAGATGTLARALLFGPALITLQLCAYHVLQVRFGLTAVILPWWILAGLAAWRRGPGFFELGAWPSAALARATLALLAILAALNAYIGLWLPVIGGDAVLNFALNARVFATEGSFAPEALLSLKAMGHREYPPLLASNEALLFQAGGLEGARIIRPFFALAYLAVLLLVHRLCEEELGSWLAALTATAIGAAPIFWVFGENGYADLRLTACVLVVVLEGRELARRPARGLAFRLALAALACALTKNEGIPVAAACGVFLVALGVRSRLDWQSSASAFALLAAGSSFWPLFKAMHGISDLYIAGAAGQSSVENLLRLPRILVAFAGFTMDRNLNDVLHWGVLWPAAAMAIGWALFGGTERRELAVLTLCLLLHLSLYVIVFVMTPHSLEWHLQTAGGRLLLHASPWMLVLFVASIRRLARQKMT